MTNPSDYIFANLFSSSKPNDNCAITLYTVSTLPPARVQSSLIDCDLGVFSDIKYPLIAVT